MKHVFLLSLPRSGSTLMGRLLSSHPEISVPATEPWVLIPPVFASRPRGVHSSLYDHGALATALNEMELAGGADPSTLSTATRRWAEAWYESCSPRSSVAVVDKTPRYHLILDLLTEAFPDAYYIFLWRNPLAIAASISTTWHGAAWSFAESWIDLYWGFSELVRTSRRSDVSTLTINYESLTLEPTAELSRVYEWLGIAPHNATLAANHPIDRIGDPRAGSSREVDARTNERWVEQYRSRHRRRWARKYLNWIGDDRLELIGYSRSALLSQVHSVDPLALPEDTARTILDFGTAGTKMFKPATLGIARSLRDQGAVAVWRYSSLRRWKNWASSNLRGD